MKLWHVYQTLPEDFKTVEASKADRENIFNRLVSGRWNSADADDVVIEASAYITYEHNWTVFRPSIINIRSTILAMVESEPILWRRNKIPALRTGDVAICPEEHQGYVMRDTGWIRLRSQTVSEFECNVPTCMGF